MQTAKSRLGTAAVVAGVLMSCGACVSNLKVRKVSVEERACGADHQNGFRYYLNRPYLVVKKPVLISQMVSLVHVVRVVPAKAGTTQAAAGDVEIEFLDGPRRGQTVRLGDLRVDNPGSDGVRAVTPDELRRMASALAAGKPADGGTDSGVVQAQLTLRDGPEVSVGGGAARAEGGDGGGGSAGSSANTTSIDLKNVEPTGTQNHTPPLVGDMEVLYLPDLDEQYVIKSHNIMAKTAFGLAFRNGGELVEVQGEHDSTTVALSVLQQIQNAIAQVQSVEQARIQQQAKQLQGKQDEKKDGKAAFNSENAQQAPQELIWQLVVRTSIKPGVYRLNKPWETTGGPAIQPTGCGLLAKLGLPTVTELDFEPAAVLKK